jgi:hypothetical protein
MPNEIEFREAANIPSPRNMYREIMEEINNGGSTLRKREPKHKGCQDNRNELMDKDHYFHSEQLAKFLMDLENSIQSGQSSS